MSAAQPLVVQGVTVTKLPPGPEREELKARPFESIIRAKKELRYGSSPDSFFAESRARTAGVPVSPRVALAVSRSEEWVKLATKERLARLPRHYREALNMFYWQGMSHREVGEALGKTEQECWYIVMRAKRRIIDIARAQGAFDGVADA